MTQEPVHCDEQQLSRLSEGQLDASESELIQQHLNDCEQCAARLQSISAVTWPWDEVVSALATDEFDCPSEDPTKEEAQTKITGEADQAILSREISGWLDPTDDPNSLGRFAGYEIIGIIGHGAMGIVLKGFESSLNRYVAIKVLAPRLATNGSARKRFAREAQAAAAVRHDNVIAIHRVDQWHGLPFLVMPYVGGVSLQKRIDSEGPLTVEQSLRVGYQIAAGLAAAHAQGLVHRDIKPANILLEQGVERVTITDFGLARAADDASLTRTGVIAGTPQYMSPEQAQAMPLDFRSDLFSLGSLLYTACTGRPPFRAETTTGVLQRVAESDPRDMREINPEVPDWLCQIVCRLHSKSPSERFEGATQTAETFQQCLAHLRQPLVNPLPDLLIEEPLHTEPRQGTWKALAVGAVLLLGGGLFLPSILHQEIPTTEATLPIADPPTSSTLNPSTLPAADPPASPPLPTVTGARYAFGDGEQATYLFAMSVERPDAMTQVEGLVTVEAQPVGDDHFQLWFSPKLKVTMFTPQVQGVDGDVHQTGSSTRSNHWSAPRAESVTIGSDGKLEAEAHRIELPHRVGTLPELLFRPLPSSDSPSVSEHEDRIVIREQESSGEIVERELSKNSGMPLSVCIQTSTFVDHDGDLVAAPVQIEFVRLTDQEKQRWLDIAKGTAKRTSPRKHQPTGDEQDRMLTELQQQRRVLYWLNHIDQRSVDELSQPLIDALYDYLDHSNLSYRKLASSILSRVPDEHLNPFQVSMGRYDAPDYETEQKIVSVWAATVPWDDIPEDYWICDFDGGDDDPWNRFSTDFGFGYYDDDFVESYFDEPTQAAVPIKQLIDPLSYSKTFVDAVVQRSEQIGVGQTCYVFLMYGFKYDPAQSGIEQSKFLRFVGAFPYQE